MALIMAAITRSEKILIISPSLKQSGIIMGNVIAHLFDDQEITSTIEYEGSLERLRQERSKSRITFKRYGSEIFLLTAEADTISKEAKNVMGFGATLVVSDESGLIPDIMWSKILRMIGGVKSGKIVQLGNPFDPNNHFARSFDSPRYEKLIVKWPQAVEEGRVTQQFIDEAREEMSQTDFRIFYDCEFPEGNTDDSLIPLAWIQGAINQSGCEGDYGQVGLDVARFGRDKTVYCFRKGGEVKNIKLIEKMDTMEVAGQSSKWVEEDTPDRVAIDVIGIGSGVVDRLNELGYDVLGVNVGEAAEDEKYYNKRAEIYWNLRELFKPDKSGKSQISIPEDQELIKELSEIRYRYSSEKKIKIEPKEEMKKRLGRSPDKADALALAFYQIAEPELIIM